jgi:hypothetical protein
LYEGVEFPKEPSPFHPPTEKMRDTWFGRTMILSGSGMEAINKLVREAGRAG